MVMAASGLINLRFKRLQQIKVTCSKRDGRTLYLDDNGTD